MTVGIDTYVTVAEADEIVRLLLRPYDELNVFWRVLSEEEKEGYLMRSARQIDSLVFTGRKRNHEQVMQFPRNYERDISKNARQAAVYNALGLMNADIKSTSDKQLQLFKSLGAVKNLRLDQTSMRTVASAESAEPKEVVIPLASATAYDLLKSYMRGSFSIR